MGMTTEKPAPLTPEEIDALEPDFYGPTWARGPLGNWLLPERTLGWQIIGWCADYLNSEASSEEERMPWAFTPEQARFILWWYAVDERGRFVFRKGVLQRLKGWGKDPLAAVMCLVELVGPSRFDGWDADGNPIGVPHPQAWVQISAVNQEQTTNTMALMPSLMSEHFKATYNVEPGAELIRAMGGKVRLQAVTRSYRALEGGRITFTLLNETHHWVSGNNGMKMYETIDGNATKKDSRYLAITNAYLPGEDSVAERMRDAWGKIREGRAADIGFLYDSIEAHPQTPLSPDALRIVIPKIRGDATWLNIDAIIASVLDVTISAARSRRMWLNQIVAGEDALYGEDNWKAIEEPDALLRPGDEVVLGFDGGRTDDSTALVALRVSDMCAFVLGLWERPDGPAGDNWEVDQDAVDSAVHEAHSAFSVRAFYADVALWESYISEWAKTWAEGYGVKAPGKDGIGWDMRGSKKLVTLAHERLMRSIFDVKLKYDGDLTLRRHALNARRRTNDYGVGFGKESRESTRKVDAYAALMLAHEALVDLRAKAKPVKQRTGQGYFL